MYLLHWPALVFVNYHEHYSGTEVSGWGTVILIALVYAGGWLSWRFVESPFRKSETWTRRRIYLFAWSGIGVLFAQGSFCQKTPIFMSLLPDGVREMAEARFTHNPMIKDKGSLSEIDNPHRYGSPDAVADTVLWGDSHAGALAYPLHELALRNNRAFLYHGRWGAPPINGVV